MMINPSHIAHKLAKLGVDFYVGVPDSLLKDFCAFLSSEVGCENHMIASNEGAAIALGIGHYLATGKVPMVYLQNSGLGNVINPVLSLASPQIYGIPMLILMGWRGEPGIQDEPQHLHQGEVMLGSLDAMKLPYTVLSTDEEEAFGQLEEALALAKGSESPVFVVARKGSFSKFVVNYNSNEFEMSREEAVAATAGLLPENGVIVSTTGMASRELFEYRSFNGLGHDRDFLTVGGMGHASQIALGLSKGQKARSVFCLDGDGAALMHLGSLAIIGQSGATNFVHFVLNNGVHDSVGGQPTVGFGIDFCGIALACGYASAVRVEQREELETAITNALRDSGPHLIEVCVRPGHRDNLGRPTIPPSRNKDAIMKFCARDEV